MSFSEKVQELNREISATVERALAGIRQEIAETLRGSHEQALEKLRQLRPDLPDSFVAHEAFAPAAEVMSARSRQEGRQEGHREGVNEIREGLAAVDRARSQAEILSALLRETGRHASRSAVLLLRGGSVRGWSGQGFGDADASIRDLDLGTPHDGAWSRAFEGQGTVRLGAAECALLCSRLEASLPREGALVPIVLRDRVAAVIYADESGETDAVTKVGNGAPLNVEALQVLAYVAGLAIESLPFRERQATATLQPVENGQPAAAAAPAAEPQVEAEEETAVMATAAPEPVLPAEAPEPEVTAAPEPEPETSAADSMEDTAVAVEPAAEPDSYETVRAEAVPEPAWQATAEPEVEVEAEAEPDSAAAWAAPEPAAFASADEALADASAEVEDDDNATPTQKVDLRSLAGPAAAAASAPAAPPVQEAAPAASPEATVLLRRPGLSELAGGAASPVVPAPEETPPPAPTPLRPVPPAPEPEPAREAPPSGINLAGTPEVRPPSDVQGPGWAFASTRVPISPNEEALHEEARRLARLLVSEIKLYNEEQVEEGRRRRDVYERLKEDIDRSRQMYEERVEPRILKSTDYFYQELVRILAAGDAKALGI
jgi:hypothetical protein